MKNEKKKQLRILEILEERSALATKLDLFESSGNSIDQRSYLKTVQANLPEVIAEAISRYDYIIALQKKNGWIYNGKEWYATIYQNGTPGPVGGVDSFTRSNTLYLAHREAERLETGQPRRLWEKAL